MVPGNPRAVPVEYVRYALLGLRPPRPPGARVDGGAGRRDVHDAGPPRAARRQRRRRGDRSGRRRGRPRLVRPARGRALPRPRRRRRRLAARAIAAPTTTCCSTRTPARTSRTPSRARRSSATSRRALAPGGVVAINIAEPEGSGVAPARAFAAVFTPFECRRTAVDGNVLLFAADGPARGGSGRDAALARRLGCARRDRFFAGRAGGAAVGGAACDRLLGAAVRGRRREAGRPGLDAGELGRRQRSSVGIIAPHGGVVRSLVEQQAHRGVRPATRYGVVTSAHCEAFVPSGMSQATSRSNGAVIRSRPPGVSARLS